MILKLKNFLLRYWVFQKIQAVKNGPSVTEHLGRVTDVVMHAKPLPDSLNVLAAFVGIGFFALAAFINFAL